MPGQKLLVGDVVKFSAFCVETEQVAINTFYMQTVSTVGNSVTTQDCAALLDTDLAPAYKNFFLANTATYLGMQAQVDSGQANLIAVFANANKGPGTRGIALPRQTAGLLSFYDGFRGRGHRGRMYFPFPGVQDDVAGGKPSGGAGNYVLTMGTVGNVLLTGINVVGAGGGSAILAWVLRHKAVKGPPAVPVTYTPITSYQPRSIWATQRRRGSYGRPNIAPF